MIDLQAVFAARDIDVCAPFGHGVIYEVTTEILVVDIYLDLSFLACE